LGPLEYSSPNCSRPRTIPSLGGDAAHQLQRRAELLSGGGQLARIERQLANESFVAKAPANDAVAARQARFNDTMEERAELEREANVLRDMMLQQLKADEEALKKYIAMI